MQSHSLSHTYTHTLSLSHTHTASSGNIINGQAQGGPKSFTKGKFIFTKGKTNVFSLQGLRIYSGDIIVGQAHGAPDFEMILKQNEMS
jgi:hypothetical protein